MQIRVCPATKIFRDWNCLTSGISSKPSDTARLSRCNHRKLRARKEADEKTKRFFQITSLNYQRFFVNPIILFSFRYKGSICLNERNVRFSAGNFYKAITFFDKIL